MIIKRAYTEGTVFMAPGVSSAVHFAIIHLVFIDRCLDTYDYCRHFAKAYCEKPYFIAKCRKTCRHCQTSRKQKKNGNCKLVLLDNNVHCRYEI